MIKNFDDDSIQLKVGDKVMFMNESGIVFGPYEVLDFIERDKVMFLNEYGIVLGPYEVLTYTEFGQDRCVYIDYGSWMPARERSIMQEEEYYRKAEQWLMEAAEPLGWKVLIYGKYIELSKCTSRGQDFAFTLKRNSIYQNGIYEHYSKYDKDILTNMNEVKDDLRTLFLKFKEYNLLRFKEHSL